MAASNLDLDLEGTNPANEFLGEVKLVDTSADRSVWPENYPFFINDGTFSIEGRIGAGAWTPLQESIDFVYSPHFSEYSINTGKEIVSYVLIMNDALTEVRFNYKALGKYTDTTILNEIQILENAGKLDRASMTSWMQVKGQSPNYALSQDPNVVGRSHEEVIWLGLSKILEALNNPNSVTAILPKDITAINLALAEKVSAEQVAALILENTIDPYVATANEAAQMYRFPGNIVGIKGTLMISENAGTANNMVTFNIFRDANAPAGTWRVVEDEGYVGTPSGIIPAISIAPSGSEFVVICQCTAAVTYQFKLAAQFAST